LQRDNQRGLCVERLVDPGEGAVQQTVVAASMKSAVYSGDCPDTGRSTIKRGKMQEMRLPPFFVHKITALGTYWYL